MSSREERAWLAYESVFGSLELADRIEPYLADIAFATFMPLSDEKRNGKLTRAAFVHDHDLGIGKPQPEEPDGPTPALLGLAATLGATDERAAR